MKRPVTVCDALASLPRQVETHELLFEPHIFYDGGGHAGTHDVRFCYELVQISEQLKPLQQEAGSWFNPFHNGYQQSFLYLVEGIENDAELVAALLKTRAWLLKKGVITASDYPPFEDEAA